MDHWPTHQETPREWRALAGQSEAFCGCVAERLGPNITSENLETLRVAIETSINGEVLDASPASGEPADAATREALIQCATRSAVQGAIGDTGN